MKKLIPLILLIVLALTGCFPSYYADVDNTPDPNLPAPQSIEELYSLYNTVERDMSKAELDELYGEPTPSEYAGEIMFYKYFNETKSAGVAVYFSEDNKVTGKTLFYNTKSNLVPFSNRYIYEKIQEVKPDMTIDDAIEVMDGAIPLEISCTYGKDGPESSKNIYYWCNEDGSIFRIDTNNGIIENCVRYE